MKTRRSIFGVVDLGVDLDGAAAGEEAGEEAGARDMAGDGKKVKAEAKAVDGSCTQHVTTSNLPAQHPKMKASFLIEVMSLV